MNNNNDLYDVWIPVAIQIIILLLVLFGGHHAE